MVGRKKQIITGNEISEIYTFTLGGFPQKVLIEGKRKSLPVVINLHGGPGTPIPFSVGCRGLFPVFTDRFIMVYWDQLGCGINDYPLKDAFTVDYFVTMTVDLIAEVKKMFPSNQLILFGMSWGSVLALKSLQKMHSEIDAVVTWGQILRNLFFNQEVYTALEHAGFSKKKMQKIRSVSAANFTDKDLRSLTKNIRKYTTGYSNPNGELTPIKPIIKGLLTSPDYKLKDFKAIMVNGTASCTRLWPELLNMDLSKELSNIAVPYYILQGDTDIVASTAEIQKELALTDNPNLHLRVIANSGHIPGKAGMDAVFETLTSIRDCKGV